MEESKMKINFSEIYNQNLKYSFNYKLSKENQSYSTDAGSYNSIYYKNTDQYDNEYLDDKELKKVIFFNE